MVVVVVAVVVEVLVVVVVVEMVVVVEPDTNYNENMEKDMLIQNKIRTKVKIDCKMCKFVTPPTQTFILKTF